MENVQSEVTDLRARSMRDNILIHNFPYKQGENLMQIIPETIKDTLGVDIQFVRIHRNSVKGVVNSKPVSITGKLVDRKMKDELLQAQKSKKKKMAKVTLPFFHNNTGTHSYGGGKKTPLRHLRYVKIAEYQNKGREGPNCNTKRRKVPGTNSKTGIF